MGWDGRQGVGNELNSKGATSLYAPVQPTKKIIVLIVQPWGKISGRIVVGQKKIAEKRVEISRLADGYKRYREIDFAGTSLRLV